MSLDESLFAAIARRVQRWRRAPTAAQLAADAETSSLLPRIRVLASAIAGVPVDVRAVAGSAAVAGSTILVPATFAELPTRAENQRIVLAFAVFAAALVRCSQHGVGDGMDDVRMVAAATKVEPELNDELPGWASERDALAAVLLRARPDPSRMRPADALVEALIQQQLGRPHEQLARLLPAPAALAFAGAHEHDLVETVRALGRRARVPDVSLWGRLLPPMIDEGGARTNPGDPPEASASERASPDRAPPRRRRRLASTEQEENPLTHSFEKVHTIEEHQGGDKHADGSDELGEHGSALDEIDLDEVVLSNQRTSSVYRADALFTAGAIGEAGASDGLRYDEWDGARSRYLPRWCRLAVETPSGDACAGAALRQRVIVEERQALAELRAAWARAHNELRWHSRQPDGPEVDVDAVIDRAAALAAGHDASARLYRARRRRAHDLAVLLLVDGSSSTDGWVANRRVLDTERDAVTLLLLTLGDVVDEVAVAAFCSESREDCRFLALKGFAEPVATGLARLATLRPAGYTRMGPAIRHANAVLGETSARRKLLVLVTDGKPTDADHYEGRHGIADVRQAVREGDRAGITTFALALDPSAHRHLPAMFGPRAHAGLLAAADLARAATELSARLRFG